MDGRLTNDQRRDLYWSLLRGIANECQDKLCAEDSQHAWGPWERYKVEKDGPKPWELPIDFSPDAACNETYRVAARRTCLNCSKEQFDG